MKQLSGVDASFLYMETATTFGHVSGLSVFERPDEPGWSPYDALVAKIGSRLDDLEPLRRRVIEVPFQLDHPYWIQDPDFSLDYHIRETAIPPPGDEHRLGELVSRLISRPLDRAHPLWEAWVIEGLSDHRFAILTKLHHATIDGAAGAELMTILFDDEPHPADISAPYQPVRGEPVPSGAQVLARALTDVARKPRKLVRLQVRSLRALGELTRNQGLTGLADLARIVPSPIPSRARRSGTGDQDRPPTPPRTAAPSTPFNKAITAGRRLALRSTSLGDIKAIKNATGATVNDVVMAVCAGALRRYLEDHDALPEAPLVAMVPVSIRTGQEEDRWTNRVSAIFAAIPTNKASPLDRIVAVHQEMEAAKDRFNLIPADVLTDFSQFSAPALAIRAARLSTRLRIADRTRPPVNLVISNVPGPRNALYLAGATLKQYYPVSTITEGQGLNITVQSYRDNLDWALVGARDLLPDLEHLAELIIDEISTLVALSAGEPSARTDDSGARSPSPSDRPEPLAAAPDAAAPLAGMTQTKRANRISAG